MTIASPNFRTITIYVTPEFTEMATPLSNYGMRGQMMLFNDPVMHLNPRQQERCYKNMEYVRTRYEECQCFILFITCVMQCAAP